MAFYKNAKKNEENLENPVSVIICAKNEEKNLKKNLYRILNQNYRSFEVIVVDDNSTDSTWNVLQHIRKKSTNLRPIKMEKNDFAGKKLALDLGIKMAKNDVLLLTDADCIPKSENWIREMQKSISNDVEIVLGYGPYNSKPGLLNKFIQFETIYSAIQYFSFALAGFPYMGVGRNLMYKKDLFEKTKGFTNHLDIISGDDDLFINEVANKYNSKIEISGQSFVYSEPSISWKTFYKQKSRHLSTGKKYKLTHRILLGILSLSHFFHYLLLFIAIILKVSIIFAVLIYSIRIGIILFYMIFILKKLKNKSLLIWIPLLDVMFVFYYLVMAPKLFFNKNISWN